jgi:hypothetical protein
MIKFRQKDFSILSSTLTGAGIGGSFGTFIPKFGKKHDATRTVKKEGKEWVEHYKEPDMSQTKGIAIGLIVGAALGALVGTAKEISKRVNRANTVDRRLLEKVLLDLKHKGYREGVDYVLDPEKANKMRTKVCIVISKYSDELRILINTVKDPKLSQLATNVVKNIPNSSNVVTRATDKYNDIVVSTISDSSVDAGLVCGIAEKFIHSGFPVYLVEVG